MFAVLEERELVNFCKSDDRQRISRKNFFLFLFFEKNEEDISFNGIKKRRLEWRRFRCVFFFSFARREGCWKKRLLNME